MWKKVHLVQIPTHLLRSRTRVWKPHLKYLSKSRGQLLPPSIPHSLLVCCCYFRGTGVDHGGCYSQITCRELEVISELTCVLSTCGNPWAQPQHQKTRKNIKPVKCKCVCYVCDLKKKILKGLGIELIGSVCPIYRKSDSILSMA